MEPKDADADGLSRVPCSSYDQAINFPDVLKAMSNSVSASVFLAASLALDESSVPTSEVDEIPNILLHSTALSDYDWVK